METSYQAMRLLKVCVATTGEKEVNEKGEEIVSQRRLNGEEASQRRFFYKAVDQIEKDTNVALQALGEPYNEHLNAKRAELQAAAPQAEGEKQEDFNKRIDAQLLADKGLTEERQAVMKGIQAINEAMVKFEIKDKTKDFLKKYFIEFGDKCGYSEGDDVMVEELNSVFGIA